MKAGDAVRHRVCAGVQGPVGASARPRGRQRPLPQPRRSPLGIAQRRPVDADGVALVTQATEQGLDQRLVAQEAVPVGVLEVECRVNCYAGSRVRRPR